ncbi:MAG: 4-hydroxythreonine-4-phosphate dehydrogenase PdxA [Flavobacteriales bacterium]|nr:4-hydroxythreonine-4-phosphate dehydrogenase PdxA [Flavobacteriales bacterium]
MKQKSDKIKVGFSIGDPNGIGIEIILKALEDKEILQFFTPIIFASTKLLSHQKNILNKKNIFLQGIFKEEDAVQGKINVLNLWKEFSGIELGKPTEQGSIYARESLVRATNALKENKIDVLVTAPINKDAMQSDDFHFPGHTEFLEHSLHGKSLMLMTSDLLNVALVTQHIPINEVAKIISKELIIEKALILNKTLVQDYGIPKPKIAILGLNPHAGDNGLLGKEELEIIEPAIKELFNDKNILAFGPYPADSFFCGENLQKFDAILAMYHDQGLIPFKTLTFESGVNFTAGLSEIRTSPDHGVAYDIAGKGIADPTSLKSAIYKAIELYKNREEYAELSKNKLKSRSKRIVNNVDEDLPEE